MACFRQEKECVLEERLSIFKDIISVISHLMSRMESCIQWCSESIKKQMEKHQKRVASLEKAPTRLRFRGTNEKRTPGIKQGDVGKVEAWDKKVHSPEQPGKTG